MITDHCICPYCRQQLLEHDFSHGPIRAHIWRCSARAAEAEMTKRLAIQAAEREGQRALKAA